MSISGFMGEHYGLKGNPFLDHIARKKWLKTWVDREQQLEQWERVISAAASPVKNYIVFVIGDYGRGKTLSLLKIVSEAGEHGTILPRYLTFKGEEKPRRPGLEFIFRIFKSIDFKELRDNQSDKDLESAIESLPNDLTEVKVILKKIYFGDNDLRRLAGYFVRGEVRGLQSELGRLGVLRRIDDIDIGKEYLGGLLAFIRALGFSTLLLAIDEFEYLFSLVPRAQQAVYLALLRGLYDFPVGFARHVGSPASMAFFVAISEDGWRRLSEMERAETSSGGPIQPLLDRVDGETVLGDFNEAQTRELIENRLRFDRIEGKYLDEPLIPFTQDFVDLIFDETKGHPRRTIVRCGHVLDVGLAEGVSQLDAQFARRALEERDWS